MAVGTHEGPPSSSSSPSLSGLLALLWRSRWLVLVASFWLQTCAGIGYAFGSFSPLLKRSLGYSQQQITILGNAKDVGGAIGLVSGSLCEVLPTWAIVLIGALQILFGYGALWLVSTQRMAALPFWMLSMWSMMWAWTGRPSNQSLTACMALCHQTNCQALPWVGRIWLSQPLQEEVCALIFIGANGETYFNTAALVTNVKNFPKSRGQVVGLLKGSAGLCGAIFTQIYTTFLYPDESAYLLMVATGPVMVAFFVMFIIRPLKAKAGHTSRSEAIGFVFIYSDCIILAAYLMGVMLLQDFVTVSQVVSLIITFILMLILLLPLATPLVCWCVKTKVQSEANIDDKSSSIKEQGIEAPLLEGLPATLGATENRSDVEAHISSRDRIGSFAGSAADFSELEDENSYLDLLSGPLKEKKKDELRNRVAHAAAEGAVRVKRKKGPRRGEDFTLLQAFAKADFWLLFWALVCGSGTGLTAIDNLGQISQSQYYDNQNVFVSMMSIWNFLGRLVGGYASEVIVRGYALPRPLAMVVAQALMAVGHFLCAMAWPGSLYVATFLLGLGYGSHWGIIPATLSELFGMKNFGLIYNFYIMASPAGSLFFSGFLAGYVYDIEAAKQNQASFGIMGMLKVGTATCYGAVCFRLTFLIMTGVCMLGIVLTMVLCARTRAVYKMLYEEGGSRGGNISLG